MSLQSCKAHALVVLGVSYQGLVLRMPSVCKNAPLFVMNGLYMAIFFMGQLFQVHVFNGKRNGSYIHILVVC